MRGECICGAIVFEVTGSLPELYQCHCSICRKQGGSASNTGMIVAKENFSWLSGQKKISSYVKESGFRSDFCSVCGAVVPNRFRDRPYVWVPAGALDDSEPLEIIAHICVDSKASWDKLIPKELAQYDSMPTLTELIDLVHLNTGS
ncbi:GFA family protein [Mariprofundus ferrooxydans]|uniref:GFA family protein n=1 Tax=Mariprofundus ferrooxydans TaxID=314344 RepID=UPI000366E234|nr:GFA family protein [Mariprofundus ferrooxydans]